MVPTRTCLALAALAVGFLVAAPAQAAFPGQNGKIAYNHNGDISVMNADGTGQLNISDIGPGGHDREPAWSPDGTKIAFASDRAPTGVFLMNANGSGVSSLAPGGNRPTWSPDGTKVAYMKFSGNQEIFVRNTDGSGTELNISVNAAHDRDPAWSPDGTKIVFVSERSPAGIWVMDANGSNPLPLASGGAAPEWSPDGSKIAFTNAGGVFVMNANGSGAGLVASGGTEPAWSPDGTKIAFTSSGEVFSINADGSGTADNLTDDGPLGALDKEPDWQPVPAAPPPAGSCGDTVLQLNRATVEGNLEETAAGSGIFRAGPGDKVFVGGFELLPRIGGELLVDTNTNQLSEGGDGVNVFFGIFPVPLDVDSLPTNLPEATLSLNKDGTLLKSLFSLPIAGSIKVAWAEDGKATNLEFELEVEKLVGDFGSFEGAEVQKPSLKATASQKNCTGFDFTGFEVRADELSFVAKKLRTPRKLGLKNVLVKYEDRGDTNAFTGQGELLLPIGPEGLAVGGKVTIANNALEGLGVSVSGINRNIGRGIFLQRVQGEFAFAPEFAANFGVEATLGPVVEGKKLVQLTGALKNLAFATECRNGEDPVALVGTGSIPLVEAHNAGSVKIEAVNCLYTNGAGIEQSPKVEGVFGEVVNGEVPRPAALVKANLTGFIGTDRFVAEGGGEITIPVIGTARGQVSISDVGLAACGGVSFFSGGIGHRWGQSTTDVFTHCDVAEWRADAANQSASSSARTETVRVRGGLPFVGFSARGPKRPPRVRVTGPKGESFTSRDGRAVVRRNVVMVPSAIERRTFVFVKSPNAGRWTVEALRGGPITELRTANGLPKPQVVGEVTGAGATRTFSYFVRRIPGQQVTFFERTNDGIVQQIGRATAANGRIPFTLASTGQPARIEAVVEQDGLPRDTIVVTGFTSAAPSVAKPPNPPRRVRVRRVGRGLVVTYLPGAGTARYRVDVRKGSRRVARRKTSATRLRIKRVPAARLRVDVRGISPAGAESQARVARIRPRR